MARLIALDPQKHKLLLTVPSALDDLKDERPAFSSQPGYFGTQPALNVRFRGAREVVDVRYALLEYAFQRWASHLAAMPEAAAASAREKPSSLTRKGPVLEAGVLVLEDFSHLTPVFTTNGFDVTWFEMLMLRLSVKVRAKAQARVVVLDALDEARLDAAAAIHQDAAADFDKRLFELLRFFDELIESSHFITGGKVDNWVLLQSSVNTLGGRPIAAAWFRSLGDLHSVALSAIETRGDFAESTVRVPSRLFARQSDFLSEQLKSEYISLQHWHIRLLLDWAAQLFPAAASGEPGRLLREPLKGRYNEILKQAVSAWESLKNWHLVPGPSERPSWGMFQDIAPHVALHLKHSAALVAACLRVEDRAGTYWFGDSFLQWRSQLQRYGRENGLSYTDRFKVLYDDLLLSITDFRAKFPLAEYQTETADKMRSAWCTGVGNLWKDVALTLVATTVTRLGSIESPQTLSADFVHKALGVSQEVVSSEENEAVATTADQVIASLLRVHAIGSARYSELIDGVAETLVPSAVSEGVPGRMYGSVGTALDRLVDGYLLMLALLSPVGWRVSSSFDEAVRSWIADDEVRQRILNDFNRWREQASNPQVRTRLELMWPMLVVNDEGRSLSSRLDTVAAALEDFIRRVQAARLEDIKALPLDADEMLRVSNEASAGLRDPWDEAPFCFFGQVGTLDVRVPAENYSARITGWDKGTLTKPRMAQPAVNEGEHLKDAVRQTAARQVMRSLLAMTEGPVQGVESQAGFLRAVKLFAAEAIEKAETPLLLVPSRAQPTWLVQLARHPGSGPRLRRLPGHDESRSYVGHLGDVEVQIAPCNPGESVLCWRSVFESFRVSDVAASTSEESEPQRCTLVLSWHQRALFRRESRVLRLRNRQKPDS